MGPAGKGSDPGKSDLERREKLRKEAEGRIHIPEGPIRWWAFRIRATKAERPWIDADNIPKIIMDAFCKRQLERDGSRYGQVGLYEDDTIEHVRYVAILAAPGDRDRTIIEVFGKKSA